MRESLHVFARIAGSVVGSLLGAALLFFAAAALVTQATRGNTDDWYRGMVVFGALGVAVGAVVGTAAGAAIVRRVQTREGSFWKGLLGAVVGLLASGLSIALCYWVALNFRLAVWACFVLFAAAYVIMIAGAIVGSGRKAGRLDAAGSGDEPCGRGRHVMARRILGVVLTAIGVLSLAVALTAVIAGVVDSGTRLTEYSLPYVMTGALAMPIGILLCFAGRIAEREKTP